MAKEISPSRKLAAKVIFEAFKVLKASGGTMRGFDVVSAVRNNLSFNEWESHRYEKTGYVRWESILAFFSIDCVKAGYLQKNKGVWILTPEGESAMKLGADAMLNAATKAYRDWNNTQKSSDDNEFQTADIVNDAPFDQKQKVLLDQYEDKAYQGLRDFLLSKNPYEFQDLIAALLNAMGYFIAHISPKGRDGGIDIIAYTDPLGTKPPRIIVQVKHRPDSTVPSDDIQRLVGTMKRDSDVGIFATSGEFSQPAKLEARLSGKHIELIDFDRFIELWKKYYDKLNDEQKNMLPLRPIYFLGSNE